MFFHPATLSPRESETSRSGQVPGSERVEIRGLGTNPRAIRRAPSAALETRARGFRGYPCKVLHPVMHGGGYNAFVWDTATEDLLNGTYCGFEALSDNRSACAQVENQRANMRAKQWKSF